MCVCVGVCGCAVCGCVVCVVWVAHISIVKTKKLRFFRIWDKGGVNINTGEAGVNIDCPVCVVLLYFQYWCPAGSGGEEATPVHRVPVRCTGCPQKIRCTGCQKIRCTGCFLAGAYNVGGTLCTGLRTRNGTLCTGLKGAPCAPDF